MERVLITGVSGFSGAGLLEYLREESVYRAQYFGVSRTPVDVPDGVEGRVCDLTDSDAVEDLLSDVRPTRVFHLSGTFTNEFDADYDGNVLTTRNLLDAALSLDKQRCRILIPGSAAEYGYVRADGEAVSETCPLQPVSVYGVTKVFQTSLAQFYARVNGLHVVVARTFNLIGRRISTRLLVGRMYDQILAVQRGDALEIRLGDISGARDYIDIRDAIRAYVTILERGNSGEVYNVGSGKLTSIRYILRLFLSQFGMDADVVRTQPGRYRPSDVSTSFCADTKKLRDLGWSPELTIEGSVRLFA